MDEWQKTTLGEVANIIMGQSPTGETCNDEGKGLPLLNGPTEFGNYHPFPNQFTIDPKKIAEKGDLLFCVRGSTTGRMNWADQKYAIGRGIAAIKAKDGDTFQPFIKVIIEKELNNLLAVATGSTFPNISKADLHNLVIHLPPIDSRIFIADFAKIFDAKIENLRKHNNTLEQIAQTIFKHWFIDFEFPNTDDKPYKSSGGEMQSSELGDIPVGWRVGTLGDFVNVINGYSYKRADLGTSDVALINLKNFNINGDFRLDGFKEIVTSNYQDKHLVKPNDLLVAHTDLTQNAEVLGNPILVQPLNKYSKYVISMDLVCIQSKTKNINNFFLYYLLLNRIFKSHCIGYSNGTTVLHLSKKAVPEFKFAIPNDYKYISNFQTLAELNRKKITNNGNQIQTLTNIRDTLLPKLMSGELRVK
jgi:type I restriction enzyme S subunit